MSEDRARAREPEEDRAGRAAAAADVEAHRAKAMNDESGDDVEAHRAKARAKSMNDEAGDDVEAHRVIPRAKT